MPCLSTQSVLIYSDVIYVARFILVEQESKSPNQSWAVPYGLKAKLYIKSNTLFWHFAYRLKFKLCTLCSSLRIVVQIIFKSYARVLVFVSLIVWLFCWPTVYCFYCFSLRVVFQLSGELETSFQVFLGVGYERIQLLNLLKTQNADFKLT